MKKLLTLALFATSTVFMSLDSNATERNPWSTFKEVAHKFHTANGQFQNLCSAEQNDFLIATEQIKSRLSSHNNEKANAKLKQISLAESIFKFVWESKPMEVAIDVNMEIPEPPVVQ
jgi:hypothetical protein